MVLNENDNELDTLSNGGDNLRVEHEERAITHHDDGVTRLICPGNTNTCGNFITHAGEGIFNVVTQVIAHAPKLVEITRE